VTGQSGVQSSLLQSSRWSLLPTQPTIQYAMRVTSAGVKQKGQKVEHWAPSSAQLNYRSCTSTPLYTFTSWTGSALPLPFQKCLIYYTLKVTFKNFSTHNALWTALYRLIKKRHTNMYSCRKHH